MRILVTGGCGFIGSATVEEISKEAEVHAVVYQNEPDNKKAITKFIRYEEIPNVEFEGYDAVLHLMANNDTQSIDRKSMFEANLDHPKIIFESAHKYGCVNFVYASSTAVYGNSDTPYQETTVLNPLTVYAESKIEFDKWANEFSKSTNSKVIGLRYCNVYGPGEDRKGKRKSMIGQIIDQAIDHKQVKIFKDGKQERDWVYIDDVVKANLASLKSNKSGIYNIGSGESSSFNQICSLVFEHMKYNASVEYIDCPFSETYQSKTLCDIKKARLELGFKPSFDLRSGIKSYVTFSSNAFERNHSMR